jgi:hypothetical protein
MTLRASAGRRPECAVMAKSSITTVPESAATMGAGPSYSAAGSPAS